MNKDKVYWSAIIRTLVAKEMRVEPETIDPEQNFTSYGLDSIVALSVSGDLEDLTKLELEPTLLWDYPTINALAEYLVSELQQGVAS
ncbi:acyl carrier protein [Acinetobacter pittii]|uniref:Acyl carrier protein n=1 Tax=Acinetobacter pittii TaxID=48296 RepID=A0A1C2TZX8_ACIPI|nr:MULTISPECIES: acyl carrier protein [Acinetobacter]MDR0066450.1 acyl carrier protein [Acinetobacter sp. 11520]MDU6101043.1 acyl carrier protein [Acinetobacter sp.]AMM27956.1 acyl carrier protein [Acinetobacter pittii]EXB00215.1 phosphopantetheine attachment site family protein [Acinetobacter sp. 1295259]KQE18088.1 acyl carrier protein [Acinetobacter pittii]